MGNPVDFGNTPLANGAVRGFIAAIITGVLYGIYGLQAGKPLDESVMMGAVPMLLAFLGLLGYGVMDQNRANSGIVNPADVPVQLESKVVVVGDSPAGRRSQRNPKQISEEWTDAYQRTAFHDR